MGKELTAIGDQWEEVAAAFAAAAEAEDPADLLPAAVLPMHDIADHEEDFWTRLQTAITA